MLAEFLQKVVELALRGGKLDVATHDSLPGKVVIRQGDAIRIEEIPPAYRDHEIDGLEDFARAMQDEGMLGSDDAPEVFHSDNAIVGHLARSDRRDVVTFPLTKSERFLTLEKLQEGVKLSPKEAVRMLRFDLHGAGVEPVIQALSRVDFSRKNAGANSVSHGKESLGRSVELAVQQADAIPEEFSVSTSVYAANGLRALSRVSVRCGIYLQMAEELVEIRTLSDEVKACIDAAQEAIGDQLRELLVKVPVYFGCPKRN